MDDKTKFICLAFFYANKDKELESFDLSWDIIEAIAPLKTEDCKSEMFEARLITISKTDETFGVHYYKITDKGVKEYKRLATQEKSEKWRRVRSKYWWVILIIGWLVGLFTDGLSEMVSKNVLQQHQEEIATPDTVEVYRQKTDTLYLPDSSRNK